MEKLDDKMLDEQLGKALDQQQEVNLSAEFVQQVLTKATAGEQIKMKVKLYSWTTAFALILLSITSLILQEVLGADVYQVRDSLIAQKFNIAFVIVVLLAIQFMDWRVKSRRQLLTY
jgi:hypothetical protein